MGQLAAATVPTSPEAVREPPLALPTRVAVQTGHSLAGPWATAVEVVPDARVARGQVFMFSHDGRVRVATSGGDYDRRGGGVTQTASGAQP